jgi:hypothetical protein
MTVYLVVLYDNYSISDIMGVFSNESTANEEAEKFKRVGYDAEVFVRTLETH